LPCSSRAAEFEIVAVGERRLKRLQFVLVLPQRAQDFLAIMLEDGRHITGSPPAIRVVSRRPAAGIEAPVGILGGEKRAQRRASTWGRWLMCATISSCRPGSTVTTSMPRSRQKRTTVSAACASVAATGVTKHVGVRTTSRCHAPSRSFRAGHRMRADEMRAGPQRRLAEAHDLALHAADVGHDGTAGRDGAMVRASSGILSTGGASTTRLASRTASSGVSATASHHGWAGARAAPRGGAPNHDAAGEARARAAGRRNRQQAGRQNGKLSQHSRQPRKNLPPCRAVRRTGRSVGCWRMHLNVADAHARARASRP